jgi:hypothetical protein
MSDNHGRVRAREAEALQWLRFYEPGDGHGVIGASTANDPASMFTQPVVLDAFQAGADQADAEFAVERATGQTQLDDAAALMRETVDLLRGYEAHHLDRASEAVSLHRQSDNTDERRSLIARRKASQDKAKRNALQAARLEAWLRGDKFYPVTALGNALADASFGVDLASGPDHSVEAVVALDGDGEPQVLEHRRLGRVERHDFVRDQPGLECDGNRSAESCRDRFDNITNFGPVGPREVPGKSNVRRVQFGPLADDAVVGDIAALLGEDTDRCVLSTVRDGVFRLATVDPRFDPAKPVVVNGQRYHPATEA